MSTLYGLWGERSSTWLTYEGRIIAHTDAAELAFLVPAGGIVKPLGGTPWGEVLMIRHHPDMVAVQWPLDRRRFRG